ncbi:lactoylglutathione lyase [Zhengella mangrovi]|uniref:Lactoylglutathione lyase n=1 Tax=Zhengella mangrovi TaxID=1982044 RepID=A0A2G1QRP3_9HYPH|nr:VOC family protein [Zhengella mangrovi]PHP67878.1 lactoylglutathione lyase [Zhengella mangrovi]
MKQPSRPLDHLVLPVPSLAVARDRLALLGFTCAPDGIHPFGTVNTCVYFADGTFLEPLAVGYPQRAAETAREGNAFTAGDAHFRAIRGDNGFAALVLGSQDADADDAAFRAEGFPGGTRLDFSRGFRTPDGAEGEASFRLAFAAPQAGNAAFFFACQRVNVPVVDRTALETHENGVTGIRGITLAAANPHTHRAFLEAFTGAEVDAFEDHVEVVLPNAAIAIVRDPGVTDLACLAIRFACADPDALRRRLTASCIDFNDVDGTLAVPPAPGQGALFQFEA